jgi:hypothetical protein
VPATLRLTGRSLLPRAFAKIPIYRRLEDGKPAWLKYPIELADGFPVVGNVIEYVTAKNDVEGGIRMGNIGDVHAYHRDWRVEVGAQVVQIRHAGQAAPKRGFRRDVEDGMRSREEVGPCRK